MEKRALIAVAISFVILFLYQYIFIKPEPQQMQKKTEVAKKEEPAPVKPLDLPVSPRTVEGEKEIKVETEFYSAVFTTSGGTLKHYEIKKYKDKEGKNVVLLKGQGLESPLSIGSTDSFNLSGVGFQTSGKDIIVDKDKKSDSLIFEYAASGLSVKRTYTFYSNDYRIDVKDEVSGLPDYWITIGNDFGIYDSKDSSSHIGPVLLTGTKRVEPKLKEAESYRDDLKWIAQEDKYFFAALVPLTPMEEAKVWKLKDSPVIAFRGKPGVNSYMLYAG